MEYPRDKVKSEDHLRELVKFLGLWKTDGIIQATSSNPEIKITGTDTYEWLPGGYFLLHKVDVIIGDEKNETLEVIGFDKEIGKYTMQHYDNKGNSGFMTATYEKGVWTFLGDTLRFTGGFSKENTEFSGIWEQLTADSTWSPFMHIKLTKQNNKTNV